MARFPILILILTLFGAGCTGVKPIPTQTPAPIQATVSPSAALAGLQPTAHPTAGPLATPTVPEGQESPVETHAREAHPSIEDPALAMSDHHLQAGPHIRLASSGTPTDADRQRAAEFARQAYDALERFSDYQVALDEGYQVFAPDVPQDVYHFVNYREAVRNLNAMTPDRPTALLYKKVGQSYAWAGAMYSAPWGVSEAELDARYPLSMAQWHAHINICLPPGELSLEKVMSNPEFGFEGTIATRSACDAAGGRFFDQVLGWMIHVDLAPES